MIAILHTFGVGAWVEEAQRLNFTHLVTPMNVARPERDQQVAADVASMGMSVLFDVAPLRAVWKSNAGLKQFEAWASAIKQQPGVAGLWIADVNAESDGAPLDLMARARSVPLPVFVSSTGRNVDALAESLTYAAWAAYPMYRQWCGDGQQAETPTAAFGDVATAWGAFKTVAASPVKRLVMMQGFYDGAWASQVTNAPPTYASLKAVYDAVVAADSDLAGVVVFGLSAAPGMQTRYRGIAQERSLYDAVGLFNAAVRGKLFVAPSRRMVRVRDTVQLEASKSDAVWAVQRAPAGCSVGLHGAFTAGESTGEALVWATRSGEVAETRLIIYREG